MGILTRITCRARLLASRSTAERGATLVEYALLVALIAIVCVSALSTFGGAVDSNFSSATEVL